MEISLHCEGVTRAQMNLRRLAGMMGDFTPVWPEVHEAVKAYEERWFASRGEGTFAPLKQSTLKRGHRRSSAPFDTDNHGLWDSATTDGRDHFYKAEPTCCEIGVSRGPGHWHMFDRKYMPARPPLKMTADLIATVTGVVKRWFNSFRQ